MTPRLLVALTFPLLLAAGLGMGGCSALAPTPAVPDSSAAEAFPRPADGEFSVMTFNLHQYALQDAAAGSEGSAPKPRPGTDALVEAIRRAAPDVLALQEMGDSAAWTEFKFRLREAGLVSTTAKKAKLVVKGELTKAFVLKGIAATAGAKAAIEAAGGSIQE